MAVSGILNVDKPPTWTSFDVVKFIRGRCGEKRVGHAGTLDPAATGVLPVLLGQATRLTEYLVDTSKTYEATIHLGVTTNTYDADGEVIERRDASHVSLEDIKAALSAFAGVIQQVPPAYSAIKRDGVPLYKLARSGNPVHLEPRTVTVHDLQVSRFEPPCVDVRIDCGKGFYVRSLAHDLGAVLGVGGSLSALRRTRVGSFEATAAVPLEVLRHELESGEWLDRVHAPDEVLLAWDAAILGEENACRLQHGQHALLPDGLRAPCRPDALCRAYSQDGDFIGIARAGAARLEPEKIFLSRS